jgi:[ribosomal protein S5]-alanine N-acetyltransferase
MSRRIPVLETGRLIIRELTMDDLDSTNNILNRANGSNVTLTERQAWLQWTVMGYEMFAMLEQPHYGERAVVLKANGELIGAVGIVPYLDTFNSIPAFHRNQDSPATAEVGLYWAVDPAHQRQGFATEAARALKDYLFIQEKLGRVIATTGYENLASQKVMQKLGMIIHRLEEPQLPDQFVVAVIENKTCHQEESL